MSLLKIVPDSAPFNPEQREWLNKFFAMHLSGQTGESCTPAVKVPITIIWGSQTGNAEGCCKQLAKAMKDGFDAEILDMAEVSADDLCSKENLLVVTSTYGDGEAPDNANDLHSAIMAEDAPKLEGVNFAVFGLGDTEYPDFCQTAKDFDKRFEELGGQRVIDRVDADVDFEDPFDEWKAMVLQTFGGDTTATAEVEEEELDLAFGKKNPFPSSVLTNYNLNKAGSQRETHHLEFSLEGSGLEYEAGDALAVVPVNPESQVDEIIAGLGFKPTAEVPTPDKKTATLRDALINNYDIRSLNKKLIIAWQANSGSPFLRSLVQADSKEHYDDFIWGRELIDLVLDHPADFGDAEEFVAVLKKLQPRLYSISSSPKAHPGEVHLTVAVVRHDTHGRQRGGVCSTFMSDRMDGIQPGVFVHTNKAFRLPEDLTKPVIMCGPGTGIAPFRAFLEEREATQASGKNWLFFGNPHSETDFLYEDQLSQLQKKGVLTKLTTAFSRDQKEKIYVQDRMLEEGAEIWKWFQEGGHFLICGDASRMAKDVDAALHKIAEVHGGLSDSEAIDFIKQLKKEKRYSRDVY